MKPKCGLRGCSRPHYAKGYCQAHYNRVWYTGKVGGPKVAKQNPALKRVRGTCSLPGCKSPHAAKGVCWRHYVTARLGAQAQDGQRGCEFPGCKLIHAAKGFCVGHYMAMRSVNLNKLVG